MAACLPSSRRGEKLGQNSLFVFCGGPYQYIILYALIAVFWLGAIRRDEES